MSIIIHNKAANSLNSLYSINNHQWLEATPTHSGGAPLPVCACIYCLGSHKKFSYQH